MISSDGGGKNEGGGGVSVGGVATSSGKLGPWIAIGLGVLVVAGAVVVYFVK